MGRAKAFDEQAALNKAMCLFWRQGYANTSIKQLLAEMDMLNGSFYHSFKDKKTLFLKSLDFYNQEITYKRQAALVSHDNFSTGIRALLAEVFTAFSSKDMPNGCLIISSMTEDVLCVDELRAYLFKDFELFMHFITNRIQHSINLKHTSANLPAEQLAYILVTYIQGLFGMSRTPVPVRQLQYQTDAFLHALDL